VILYHLDSHLYHTQNPSLLPDLILIGKIHLMTPLANSIIASLLISSLSFLGLVLIFVNQKSVKRFTPLLVSFAIGSLLGDAFIHLIPEAFDFISPTSLASWLILLGIILFFVLERFLLWHHCHDIDCHQNSKHVVTLSLVGDTVHNFIDGALIAASFNLSHLVGLSTTLAVIFHEIPQEIGDFGIMIHHGVSVKKAVFYNFISSLASLLGVILIYTLGVDFSHFLIPITAGGFIYLAIADLMPHLHQSSSKFSKSLFQFIFLILGIILMSLLLFLE